ncbi:MAG: hydroxymethylglutaryl-CoA reductase, degradative [Polyangiaceae bacterium]
MARNEAHLHCKKDFRTLSLAERQARIAKSLGLDAATVAAMLDGGIDGAAADHMIENAIGVLGLPFGLGLNFVINDKPYVVPMAVEEPSVIAAASSAAKRILAGGGFEASADESIMAAQIEVTQIRDVAEAARRVRAAVPELMPLAQASLAGVVAFGGGAREIVAREIGDGRLVVHVMVDCRDAMGANTLNTMAEAIGDRVAEIAQGKLGLRILSNLCDQRCARAIGRIPFDHLGGANAEEGRSIAEGIESASRFAEADVYRAVTHNKGIMNGTDAVVVATGNDWRAVEAGAHAYAARDGRYKPLATWRVDHDAKLLVGKVEMPMALGIVGGALRTHKGARIAVDLLGVESSRELAMVAVSVGLASNVAALRALSQEGIQRGHMALHLRTPAAGPRS